MMQVEEDDAMVALGRVARERDEAVARTNAMHRRAQSAEGREASTKRTLEKEIAFFRALSLRRSKHLETAWKLLARARREGVSDDLDEDISLFLTELYVVPRTEE